MGYSYPGVAGTVLVICVQQPMKTQLLYGSLAATGSGLILIGEFLTEHIPGSLCAGIKLAYFLSFSL